MRIRLLSLMACAMIGACVGPATTSAVANVNVNVDANGNIHLLVSGPGMSGGGTYFAPSGVPAVHFGYYAYSQDGISNLYMFGLAPRDTAYLQTTPSGSTTIDANKLFVVVIPDDRPVPASVGWSFLSASGKVLASGVGEANDDPGWGSSILRSARPTQP